MKYDFSDRCSRKEKRALVHTEAQSMIKQLVFHIAKPELICSIKIDN